MITRNDNIGHMDFRKIIADELTAQGMTRAKLAELADMTPAQVSDYLHGNRDVTTSTLRRMLKVLGLTVHRKRGRR